MGKRTKFLTASIICLTAFCMTIGSMYMWFSDIDNKENKFYVGLHSVEVVEDFIPPDKWIPGQEVDKSVLFVNNGDIDALIRIRYEEYWNRVNKDSQNQTEEKVILSNQISYIDNSTEISEETVFKKWNALNWNENMWQDGGDGYFYYKKVLKPGEDTGEILKSVVINQNIIYSDYPVDYMGARYILSFYAEAIISTADIESIQEYFGNYITNVVVQGGDVEWTFQ